jgi:predicted RNA-binding protein YlqC (UPF0109 family)
MYYRKPCKPGQEIAPLRFSVANDLDIEPEPIPIQEAEEGHVIPEVEELVDIHESESEQEQENETDSEDEAETVITRSGREVKATKRLIAKAGYAAADKLNRVNTGRN